MNARTVIAVALLALTAACSESHSLTNDVGAMGDAGVGMCAEQWETCTVDVPCCGHNLQPGTMRCSNSGDVYSGICQIQCETDDDCPRHQRCNTEAAPGTVIPGWCE